MIPSPSSEAALSQLALDTFNLEPADFAIAPDQPLCFICLRWTTDAPECNRPFEGCDLQPATARSSAAGARS